MTTSREVRVFLDVQPHHNAAHPSGWRATWIARGSGQVMYVSVVCDSRERAVELAHKTRAQRPYLIDTTEQAAARGLGPPAPK